MSEQEFHRDRREHGGAPAHPDQDKLARLTEQERVEAGLDAYDPDEVPPATDSPPLTDDVTQTEQYREERAELIRQAEDGELGSVSDQHPFPPTRYQDS